jgi:putative protease
LELLAPAGDYGTAVTAINHGADAVYLGGPAFHARKASAGLSWDDLNRALDYARSRDKKVYVTVNTLIGDQEMDAALDYAWRLRSLAVHAVIVQDIGLLSALRSILPDLEVHASTQMTIHNQEGLDFLAGLQVKRAVLARELSLADLRQLSQKPSPVERELFVHGALCYSYSGLCLFSSLVGGRSGNRGQCAQPCRLRYRLSRESDGRPLNLSGKYLLSTADVCLVEHLRDLQDCGIQALKIEGRMKRPEYVAAVTKHYREALRRLEAGEGENPRSELEKVFNRRFTDGYLEGSRQALNPLRPDNWGQVAGKVAWAEGSRVEVELVQPVVRKDGLVFRDDAGQNLAQTTLQIFRRHNQAVERAEAGDKISFSLPTENGLMGATVYKTFDQELSLSLQPLLKEQKSPTAGLQIQARFKIGAPVRLTAQDAAGHQAQVVSAGLVEQADNQPLTPEVVREKLSRLGNTAYHLQDCQIELDAEAMFPFSDLNQLRRTLVAQLEAQSLPDSQTEEPEADYRRRKSALWPVPKPPASALPTKLSVMTASFAAMGAACMVGADIVYLDMAFIPREDWNQLAQQQMKYPETQVIPALPLIIHPEDDEVKANLFGQKRYMVSNWGDLDWARKQGAGIWVNPSLNVFNSLTLQFLEQIPQVQGICLSPELNWEQTRQLSSRAKAEIIVHGELLLMISRACLWRHHVGCQKPPGEKGPCPAQPYVLQDEKAYRFPLQTDLFCRQYIYNSRTHCLLEQLERILAEHPAAVRLEGRRCSAEAIEGITAVYRQALDACAAGEEGDREAWKTTLAALSPSPLTNGHFFRGVL